MRHASSNNRRSRGRGNPHRRSGGGPSYSRNQVFDSNGPDVRIRGTAHQICEKYMTLAKDATSVGDIVMAESYMQHAEHYQRIINSWIAENPQHQPQQEQAYNGQGDAQSDDDLSLPGSILGGEVKVQNKDNGQTADQEERRLAHA